MSPRRRIFGAAICVLVLLAVARPLESRLRAEAPPVPRSSRIGLGPLMGSVLTGSFRPLLLNYLWIRTEILNGQGRYDESHVLYRTMNSLYPHNERAREYLGWSLAYNMKHEAPNVELAWRWAEEGLDILMDVQHTRRPVANWFLKQCGQNVYDPPLRYAGRRWREERALRARATRWGVRYFGSRLGRFQIGLAALADADAFYDTVARTELLTHQVVDDWLRVGQSRYLQAAIAANRWLAGPKGFGDAIESFRELPERYARTARFLEDPTRYPESERYDFAAARLGRGAHTQNLELLELAAPALAPYPEERALIGAWIAYGQAGWRGARPSLPFDGGR